MCRYYSAILLLSGLVVVEAANLVPHSNIDSAGPLQEYQYQPADYRSFGTDRRMGSASEDREEPEQSQFHQLDQVLPENSQTADYEHPDLVEPSEDWTKQDDPVGDNNNPAASQSTEPPPQYVSGSHEPEPENDEKQIEPPLRVTTPRPRNHSMSIGTTRSTVVPLIHHDDKPKNGDHMEPGSSEVEDTTTITTTIKTTKYLYTTTAASELSSGHAEHHTSKPTKPPHRDGSTVHHDSTDVTILTNITVQPPATTSQSLAVETSLSTYTNRSIQSTTAPATISPTSSSTSPPSIASLVTTLGAATTLNTATTATTESTTATPTLSTILLTNSTTTSSRSATVHTTSTVKTPVTTLDTSALPSVTTAGSTPSSTVSVTPITPAPVSTTITTMPIISASSSITDVVSTLLPQETDPKTDTTTKPVKMTTLLTRPTPTASSTVRTVITSRSTRPTNGASTVHSTSSTTLMRTNIPSSTKSTTVPPITLPTRTIIVNKPSSTTPPVRKPTTTKPIKKTTPTTTVTTSMPSRTSDSKDDKKNTKTTLATPTKPHRTTMPSVSSPEPPTIYIIVELEMTWDEFCAAASVFKDMLGKLLDSSEDVEVRLLEVDPHCNFFTGARKKRSLGDRGSQEDSSGISVKVYVSDKQGKAKDDLTRKVFSLIKDEESRREKITDDKFKIREVQFSDTTTEKASLPDGQKQAISTSILVTVISVMSVCALSLVAIGVVVARRRQRVRGRRAMRPSIRPQIPDDDAFSLSSFSIQSGRRSKRKYRNSLRSLAAYNAAFRHDENTYSNAMTLSKLSTRSLEMDFLEEELKSIPSNMPRMGSLQPEEQARNRYANVIPLQESRVVLSRPRGNQYINANYVKGFMGTPQSYIATQAPLESTMADFWTMIWDTQSQVIVMLMDWCENGQRKCAQYIPDSDGVNSLAVYGDYEVFMKRQIVRDTHVFSCLKLKNMEKNLVRDVVHFQYLDFPARGAPSSVSSILSFIKEIRPYMEVSHGPTVVHCSTGTGRAGTLLALDICMRAYDENRTIDIMNTVHTLRQDRAGAVHTTAHYAFIYKAMLEYANQTSAENTPSKWSSRSSLNSGT